MRLRAAPVKSCDEVCDDVGNISRHHEILNAYMTFLLQKVIASNRI